MEEEEGDKCSFISLPLLEGFFRQVREEGAKLIPWVVIDGARKSLAVRRRLAGRPEASGLEVA